MSIPPDLKDRVTALEKQFPDVPPVFHHLFALLPEPGAFFSPAERVEFLRALAAVFQMVYGTDQPIEING